MLLLPFGSITVSSIEPAGGTGIGVLGPIPGGSRVAQIMCAWSGRGTAGTFNFEIRLASTSAINEANFNSGSSLIRSGTSSSRGQDWVISFAATETNSIIFFVSEFIPTSSKWLIYRILPLTGGIHFMVSAEIWVPVKIDGRPEDRNQGD